MIIKASSFNKMKSKETRMVTYTCRYSRGHLIPNKVVDDIN